MHKRTRPLGITSLAFASIIVGIFCQVAAMALLLGGTLSGVAGTDMATALLILGALYLGLMGAAYFVGYGFWSQRPWAWGGGLIVFSTLIVVSVAMLMLSATVLSVIGPAGGSVVAIWYLLRPATRAELLGSQTAEETAELEPTTAGSVDAPQAAR